MTFYQIYLLIFALKIVFDTYKFSGTTENRAILLISSNLVQNCYFGIKFWDIFIKDNAGFQHYMFKTIINFRNDTEEIKSMPIKLLAFVDTFQHSRYSVACDFVAKFTTIKCNLNIFFSCRELIVVKSTAGQQVCYIHQMYPTVSCQKYSQSTAGIITRLKALFLTTERFAVQLRERLRFKSTHGRILMTVKF